MDINTVETKQHKYELSVLEGLQQGSRQSLRMAQAHSIGNSFDCDIYLHDASDTDYLLEILPGKMSIAATLTSGQAVLDSKPMVIGQKVKLAVGVPVRIGENLFIVEYAQQMDSSAKIADIDVARANATPSADEAVTDSINTEPGDVIVDPRMINRLLQPQFLLLLIGFGLVGSGFAAWKSAPESLNTVAQTLSLEEHVQANVKGDVSVMATNEGAYMVKGWLSSREEQRNLNRVLLQRSEDVVVKTRVVGDIESSVQDVFRTYGIQAEIKTLKPGHLVVRTGTADTDMLARAEIAAKSDVHGMEELSVVNTKPVTEVAELPKAKFQNNTDQEIQLLVVGDPSYVVAANQARYFLGSKLPTGHRIESIFKDKVVLSKNGVTSELVM